MKPEHSSYPSKEGLRSFIHSLAETPLVQIRIGHLPAWFFFRTRFERNNFPLFLDNHDLIVKKLTSGKSASSGFFPRLSARALFLSERMKYVLARTCIRMCNTKQGENKSNTSLIRDIKSIQNKYTSSSPSSPRLMLYTPHTTGVRLHRGVLEIDRINRLVRIMENQPGIKNLVVVVDPLSSKPTVAAARQDNYFHSFMSSSLWSQARREGARAHSAWRSFRSRFPSTLSSAGRGYFTRFLPALDFYYSRDLLAIIALYYLTYQDIMRSAGAASLILYESGGIIERCAIAAADTLGIPSFRIYHGFGFTNKPWDFPDTHYLFAYGEAFRKRMMRLGAPPKNIITTGAVFLGNYLPFIRPVLDLSGKKKIELLFCTSTFVEENKITKAIYFNRYMRRYLRQLARIPGVQITLRLHPREKHLSQYQRLLREEGLSQVKIIAGLLSKEETYRLISQADIVLSYFSTMLLEAILLQKPTLMIELYERQQVDMLGYFFSHCSAIISVQPDDDPALPILKLIQNPRLLRALSKQRKSFINHYLHTAGDPAENAVRAILAVSCKHAPGIFAGHSGQSGREYVH